MTWQFSYNKYQNLMSIQWGIAVKNAILLHRVISGKNEVII